MKNSHAITCYDVTRPHRETLRVIACALALKYLGQFAGNLCASTKESETKSRSYLNVTRRRWTKSVREFFMKRKNCEN